MSSLEEKRLDMISIKISVGNNVLRDVFERLSLL